MANRVKKAPKATVRYYVDRPVMVVEIGEWERLVNHVTSLAMKDCYNDNQQRVLMQQHQILLKEARKKLDDAKAHYGIKKKYC